MMGVAGCRPSGKIWNTHCDDKTGNPMPPGSAGRRTNPMKPPADVSPEDIDAPFRETEQDPEQTNAQLRETFDCFVRRLIANIQFHYGPMSTTVH